MTFLDFREPVAAWTHFAGFLLAWPATFWLWKRSDTLAKRIASLLFGGSLIGCYLGSTLYHGVRSEEWIPLFHKLDYIGIYVLIAGTASPVALVLLRGRWRWVTLIMAWSTAALGIFLQVFFTNLPPLIAVVLYLLMGWGIILAYFELARAVTHRSLLLAFLGGIFYSVGAAVHVMGWPVLVPGYFGAHDLFHVLVLLGSTCHFLFMLRVVIPFHRPAVVLAPVPRQQPAVERAFS